MLYNEQNRNGRWYGRESITSVESDSWYAEAEPAPEPQTEPEPAAEPPKTNAAYFQPDGAQQTRYVPPAHTEGKKVSHVWRIVAIVALCLLAVGIAVVRILVVNFVDILPLGDSASYSRDDYDSYSDSFIPDDADMYEYFESYYTSTNDIDIASAPTGTGVTLPLAPTTGAEWSLQTIYAKLSPTVVGITCYRDGEQWSWGTGVVFTADGYIVTNAHVLEGADAADVSLTDGTSYKARFLGSDTATDLAVLKIDAKGLAYAEFADSNSCLVGDEVVAIGNPLGEQYAGTMTNGIISAIDRSVVSNGFSMTLLQTNAALNEGNSGGPLINMHGQVIGITNMKVMYTYSATVEGIGFAIPTSVIKPVVDAIIENGYVPGQPTLGIVAGSVSSEARERYDLPAGIYVTSVDKNADAWTQGLRAGDVITKVNGEKVTSVDDVNAIKDGMAVGDEITCTVYREGKTFDITFALVDKGVLED